MGDSGIDPILLVHEVKLGDKFLLCSDGLTGYLSDLEISKLAKKYDDQELLDHLLEATKAKGAPDNVTVLLVEVVSADHSTSVTLIGAANE